MTPRPNRPLLPTVRLLAAGLALLVLSLSILTVSPAGHAWLHAHGSCPHELAPAAGPAPHPFALRLAGPDPAPPVPPPVGDADHVCAVTLFAQGIPAWVPPALLPDQPGADGAAWRRHGPQLALRRPAYWHRPAQAPPQA
jgi:hypothetical protein